MVWEVRPVTPADAPQVSDLLVQLGYRVPADEIERRIRDGDTSALVAEGAGRILGLLAYGTQWHLHNDCLITSIDSLVVDEGSRSYGVGAALLDAVCEIARQAGAQLVDLHSNVSRVDARRFYERYGFVVTSNYFVKEL